MSEQFQFEFNEYPEIKTSILPDFNQVLTQKLQASPTTTGFDPYKLMVQKKDGESADITPKKIWPEKDINALEDFCKQHSIIGYNCGKMSPIAALALLKQHLGISNVVGEKVATYNQNFPYSETIKNKSIIHG